MNKWQPIETAPKIHNERFLITDGINITVGYHYKHKASKKWSLYTDQGNILSWSVYPTGFYWMSLPKPPKEKYNTLQNQKLERLRRMGFKPFKEWIEENAVDND